MYNIINIWIQSYYKNDLLILKVLWYNITTGRDFAKSETYAKAYFLNLCECSDIQLKQISMKTVIDIK